jgi:hypothetical protein
MSNPVNRPRSLFYPLNAMHETPSYKPISVVKNRLPRTRTNKDKLKIYTARKIDRSLTDETARRPRHE